MCLLLLLASGSCTRLVGHDSYFLAIALQKNHGGLVVMLVSFVGVLELVLVSVLTVFGYIVSTDVEDNEDPMTNPKLKVVKMSYDRYICGGWFLDRDNYGGNGRQTPRFSAPPFGSAQSRLREQKSLPRATLSLPLSPDEEHEGSTSSLNHSSGSDGCKTPQIPARRGTDHGR